MATETTPNLRPELDPLPRLMKNLPIDPQRGFVVPWFVAWVDGKPEFRALDKAKHRYAITHKACWVCGQKLATRYAFVVGPMCGINRTSSEPPSHIDCARWSARNCPFLNNPDMVRREDGFMNNSRLREDAPGFAIVRNPGVTALWITRDYEVFDDGRGKMLIQMGRPHEVEWYCQGRAATRREVLDSIENGIGALEAVAHEHGEMEFLKQKRKQFERWLPKK